MWLNVASVLLLSSCILLAPLLSSSRKVEKDTGPAPGRRQSWDRERKGSFLIGTERIYWYSTYLMASINLLPTNSTESTHIFSKLYTTHT
jgi:hypothetical protein